MAAWWSAVSVILVGVFLLSVLSEESPRLRQSGMRVVDRARLASEIVDRLPAKPNRPRGPLRNEDPLCRRPRRHRNCPKIKQEKKDKSKEKEDDKSKNSDEKDDAKPTPKPSPREMCRKNWRMNTGCQNACLRGGAGKPWCKEVCRRVPKFKANKRVCNPAKIKEMSQPDSSHGSDENNGRKKREHITPAAPWHSKYTAEAKKVGASGWMKCMKKGRCRKAGDCVQRSGKGYRETKCRYCSWIFHICTATPKHREGAETGTRCRDGSRYCADGNYCDMSHPRKDKAGKVYGKCVSGERPTDHTEIPYEDQTVEYGQPLNVGLARDKADTGTRRPPLQYSNNDKIGDHYNEGKRKGSYAALARVEDVDALESGEGDLLLADGKGGGPGNRRAVARKEINLFQDGVVAVPAKELETLILDSVRRVGKSGKVYRPMQGYASKIRKALGKRIPHGRYRMVIIDDVNTWDSNLRMPDGNGAVNNIEPFQPGGRVKVEGENSKVYKLFQARLNRPPSNKVRPSKKLKDIIIDFQYD